jgi:hypothetical protein
MRKLYTLLTLLFIFQYSDGQAFIVSINHFTTADRETKYIDGEFIDKYNWNESNEVDFIGVVDYDNDIIKFNNRANTALNISKFIDKEEKLDKDGDKTTIANFDGIDEEDIPCEVTIRVWHDYNLIQIYAYYSNIALCFEGKLIDKQENTTQL